MNKLCVVIIYDNLLFNIKVIH